MKGPPLGPLGRISPGPTRWGPGAERRLVPAKSNLCVVGAVSRAPWLLFTDVPAWCVALRVRCPVKLGSCSPVCPLLGSRCVSGNLGHLAPVCTLVALCWVCGVLGHLAPVHRCGRSVRCVACALFPAPWLLFAGVRARRVVLRVPCPRPSWILFTGVLARRVALRVRWPVPLCSCPLVWPLGVLWCVSGVLGYMAQVHWCVRSMRCVACAVSWATWLLFTGVLGRCVVLRVRLSGATWLLFTGVLARPVVLPARCPRQLGFYSPVCSLGVLCSVFCVRCSGRPGSCLPVWVLGVLCCVCQAPLRGTH